MLFFSIGDIEGNYNLLQSCLNFISQNPKRQFVFLGDIFNNLATNVSGFPTVREDGLRYLNALNNFGLLKSNTNFTRIEDFCQIKFEAKSFNDIESNVKFLCGNHEVLVLHHIIDAIQNNNIEHNDDQYTIKIYSQYNMKTFEFSFNELSLLFKYFSCCYGLIYHLVDDNLIVMRHQYFIYTDIPGWQQIWTQDIPKQVLDPKRYNRVYICGHNHAFGQIQANDCMLFLNDLTEDSTGLNKIISILYDPLSQHISSNIIYTDLLQHFPTLQRLPACNQPQ